MALATAVVPRTATSLHRRRAPRPIPASARSSTGSPPRISTRFCRPAAGRPSSEREPGGAFPERGTPGPDLNLFRRFDPCTASSPRWSRTPGAWSPRRVPPGRRVRPVAPAEGDLPAAFPDQGDHRVAAIERGNVPPGRDQLPRRIYGISRGGLHARTGEGPEHDPRGGDRPLRHAVFGKVAVTTSAGRVLEEYLAKFGFGERIPSTSRWSRAGRRCRGKSTSSPHRAGFGECTSPAPHGDDMSAIASGGAMPRPVLIDRIEDRDGAPLFESSPVKWRDTVLPRRRTPSSG